MTVMDMVALKGASPVDTLQVDAGGGAEIQRPHASGCKGALHSRRPPAPRTLLQACSPQHGILSQMVLRIL